MKRCCKCKVEKPECAFSKRNKTELHAECKSCFNEYYRKNKKYYIDRNKRYKENIRKNMIRYLQEHPCEDCGETDPRCLEFHHVKGKKHNISYMVCRMNFAWESIFLEISKCKVICANCHRKRTSDIQKWYKS